MTAPGKGKYVSYIAVAALAGFMLCGSAVNLFAQCSGFVCCQQTTAYSYSCPYNCGGNLTFWVWSCYQSGYGRATSYQVTCNYYSFGCVQAQTLQNTWSDCGVQVGPVAPPTGGEAIQLVFVRGCDGAYHALEVSFPHQAMLAKEVRDVRTGGT